MNRLLTILLLLAATAHGQINNPPTSVNIVDSTATGRAVLTATNAAAAATAVGLGTANDVTFNRVQVGGATFTADDFSGGDFEITATHALTFASGGTPGATLTNLGLGAANNVTFSNITASGTLGVTGNATFSGTANLAPSQTADSGSSLMTRDLGDARYSFSRWYTGYELLSLDNTTSGVKALNSGNGSSGIFNNQMVVIPDVNAAFNLPVDWRISGQVKIVSYWSDRGAINSGGTNADIAVWSTPFARSATNNSALPVGASGTVVKTVFTANYGGAARAYVVEQTMDFSTVSGINATNPLQVKFVEFQRRAGDATDTSTNTIWLSGVHIYVP